MTMLHRACAVALSSLIVWACGTELSTLEGMEEKAIAGRAATSDAAEVAAVPDDAVNVMSQALDSTTIDTNWISFHHWSQNESRKVLKSASSHVCVLTKVSGNFEGLGEKVLLYIENDTWYLHGSSRQQGVAGSATCFLKSGFSPAGSANSHRGPFEKGFSSSEGCIPQLRGTFWGSAFTFVTGIAGSYFGRGEFTQVIHATDSQVPSDMRVQNCADGEWRAIWGQTHAFYVGVERGPKLARFWGPRGKGSVAQAGEWEGRLGGTRMTPVNQTMCAFSHIGGEFNGDGEIVSIYPKDGYWYIEEKALSHGGLEARALCYLRDQDICTTADTNGCAAFGCSCATDQCSGGQFCGGTGCTAKQTQDCSFFGCGCADGVCSGGLCTGNGCTGKLTRDCAAFGCGCSRGTCSCP